MLDSGPGMMLNVLYAYISGIVLTPMMLPSIPGRPFALKGFIAGLAVSLVLLVFLRLGNNYYEMVSWFLVITGFSSFLAMNFTGSSTYTSLSGVKKEMKIAVPLQIALAVTGLVLMTIGRLKVGE
jgi:acetyl-CoA decarbonylase/synthase complex subunit gamma